MARLVSLVPALALLTASLGACSSSSGGGASEASADSGAAAAHDAAAPSRDGAADGGAAIDGHAGNDGDTGDAGGSLAEAGDDGGTTVTKDSRQSLIWIWQSYSDALKAVAMNAPSFTQVSPALYDVNYAYSSGVAQLVNTDDDFDGLTSAQFAQGVHAAGLQCVPLVYGGAGNDGTDQGIQNILNDSPAGAQQAFITSMVGEGKAKGYDGYNLDWEVQTTGNAQYGAKLVSFLTAFKTALHGSGMTLSIDLGTWYVLQCDGSGGDGLVDLTAIGPSVDWAILEDYSGALGNATKGCPSSNGTSIDCDTNFVDGLNVMCNLPSPVVSIGLISTGTNSFAGDALTAVETYGFTSVAVWPDDSVFLNDSNIAPSGSTWYSLLAGFMAK